MSNKNIMKNFIKDSEGDYIFMFNIDKNKRYFKKVPKSMKYIYRQRYSKKKNNLVLDVNK